MKQLTIKLAALIALAFSNRGQTIRPMNVEDCHQSDKGISFIIFNRLKQTRKSLKPKVVTCLNGEIPFLNVSDYVTAYLVKTKAWREQLTDQRKLNSKQLFFSWAHKQPVTKQTIAR